jgi:membrane-bound lytic murein transglycosylase A
MRIKLICSLFIFALSILGGLTWWFWSPKPTFRHVTFRELPGWDKAEFKKSLLTFQASCRVFMKQDPKSLVGTDKISLQVIYWLPICHEALNINSIAEQDAKLFFEKWFSPVEFYDGKPVKGLFTGYYMPLVKGSYTKSDEFTVPIYEVPNNMITVDLGLFSPKLKKRIVIGRVEGKQLLPYYTREEINKGALKNHARVLAWIHSPIDRLFLEIQGSAIVELEDGKSIYINYDAQNGAPYTAIAGVLIKKGVMTKHNASMQAIKKYLEAHPEQMDKVLNQNKSFVFFRKLSLEAALGSQGVALTPGYSMAIDRNWIPMGAPLWLSTTRPDIQNPNKSKAMQRLMIAQDTGGAIRGKVRGDVYWGGGDKATQIAGHMKNEGHYWILLPRQALSRLEKASLLTNP